MLISDIFIPKHLRKGSILDKYVYIKKIYPTNKYILINNIAVFSPYPRAIVPWDISEVQKIATYNPEVTKVLSWINANIIVCLGCIDYKTLDVLIRIATGMLNKCNIPNEVKIMFHDNMVENLRREYNDIVVSDLPF